MSYRTLRTAGLGGWLLQRLSAAFLVVGLFVHFWVCHFTIEKPLTIAKVASRLDSTGWIVFDLLLLLACLYHGINGIWFIINDYGPSRKAKAILGWVLVLLGACLFLWGAYLFIPFHRA